MNVEGKSYRSIWVSNDRRTVKIIDQTQLPHKFEIVSLRTLSDTVTAIKDMQVRGAPLIGATAAYGIAIAMREDPSNKGFELACNALFTARPTAINLGWALEEMRFSILPIPPVEREEIAYQRAAEICDEDVRICSSLGENGKVIIEEVWEKKGQKGAVNILTHCNAGWLATVDWGTALAPIYKAHDMGIPLHIWVDETRPRNQGASLTAWELGHHGVPATLIVDNAGGHLMQHDKVDLCITGTDRTTRSGDVCNKIGTYLKALAAHDNGIPFYVSLPGTTIDWTLRNGIHEIPIEERDPDEVLYMAGRDQSGEIKSINITATNVDAANYAFDVTPARLVTGLITERGICEASEEGMTRLYPEHA